MLGRIKENLKDWLVEHERLYWYIVVGLAVFAFGIITMLGLAKLEKANAAVHGGYTADGVTLPDIRDMEWDTGSIELMEELFGEGIDVGNKIISDFQYMIITVNASTKPDYPWAEILLTDYPVQYTAEKGIISSSSEYLYADVEHSVMLYADYSTGMISIRYGYGRKYNYASADQSVIPIRITAGSATKGVKVFGSTYDYYEGNTNTNVFPRNNLFYPVVDKEYIYSSPAPYVKFDSLDIVAPLATTPYDLKVFKDVPAEYADYNNWYWQYNGHIENSMGIVPDEYSLNMAFTCQFPTYEFIYSFWDDCIDERTLLKKTPMSVREWMANDLEAETYKFEQSFTLDVSDDGTFSLKIPYSVFHALLVYEYHELLSLYGSCTDDKVDFCDVMMSYLYVSDITMCLETSVENQIYYGRTIFNHFSKGVTNKAVVSEVLIDVATATPEELDAAISAALQKGFQDALKETQDQIDNMQNDLDSIFEVDGALSGNLEGSDLWVGFSNLAEGLASLGPSISALSVLTGAVFGFLPMTITGIMSFTLLAICIIAIIKAIRG